MFRYDPTIRTIEYGNTAMPLQYVVVEDLLSKPCYKDLTTKDLLQHSGCNWMDKDRKIRKSTPKDGEAVYAVNSANLLAAIDAALGRFGQQYLSNLSAHVSEGNVFLATLPKIGFGRIIVDKLKSAMEPEFKVSTYDYGLCSIAVVIHGSNLRIEQGDIENKGELWTMVHGELACELRLISKEEGRGQAKEDSSTEIPIAAKPEIVDGVESPASLPADQTSPTHDFGDCPENITERIRQMIVDEKRIVPLLSIMSATIEALGLNDVPPQQIVDAMRRMLISEPVSTIQQQIPDEMSDLPATIDLEPVKRYGANEIVGEAIKQNGLNGWFLLTGTWSRDVVSEAYWSLKNKGLRINYGIEDGVSWICGTTFDTFNAHKPEKKPGACVPIGITGGALVVRAEAQRDGKLIRVISPAIVSLPVAA